MGYSAGLTSVSTTSIIVDISAAVRPITACNSSTRTAWRGGCNRSVTMVRAPNNGGVCGPYAHLAEACGLRASMCRLFGPEAVVPLPCRAAEPLTAAGGICQISPLHYAWACKNGHTCIYAVSNMYSTIAAGVLPLRGCCLDGLFRWFNFRQHNSHNRRYLGRRSTDFGV